jgi:hypothetical protein
VLRRAFRLALRYKTDSVAKSLILNTFLLGHFFWFSSQALDFAGLAGHRGGAINKVIHTISIAGLKALESKT